MFVRELGPLDRGPDDGGQGSGGASAKVDAQRAVVKTVEDAITDLDWVRQHLAASYATLEEGTVAEFEIGEIMQAVRKAVWRARKGLGEVAQQELPLRLV